MPKSEPADLSASIWASQQSLPVASTERSPVHKWTATNSPFVDWLWLTSISTRVMSASRIQISIQYVYVIVDMRYPHIDYYTVYDSPWTSLRTCPSSNLPCAKTFAKGVREIFSLNLSRVCELLKIFSHWKSCTVWVMIAKNCKACSNWDK